MYGLVSESLLLMPQDWHIVRWSLTHYMYMYVYTVNQIKLNSMFYPKISYNRLNQSIAILAGHIVNYKWTVQL